MSASQRVTRFRNPSNGYEENVGQAWLWCLLAGPIYFAAKGIWFHAATSLLLAIGTSGISWIIYPVFANWTVRKHYLRKGWVPDSTSRNPRDIRRELVNLRALMMSIHEMLYPEDLTARGLVIMKTGLRLTQHLETRFGLMGPDFFNPIHTDFDLEREGTLLNRLPPEQLAQLTAELGQLAERTVIEKGNPDEWQRADSSKNAASIVALRLLWGWLRAKSIVHPSIGKALMKEARESEDLFFSHIKWALRFFRGEAPVKEGELPPPERDERVQTRLNILGGN